MNSRIDPTDLNVMANAAIDAEIALLGACLIHAESPTVAMAVVTAEHFVEGLHQAVWQTICDLTGEGRPANPLTVVARLGNQKMEGGAKDLASYLARCAAQTYCPPAYVLTFAKQVRDYWALRQVASQAIQAHDAAIAPGTAPGLLIADLIQALDQTRAIIEGRPTQGRMLAEGTGAVLDRMNRIMVGEHVDQHMTTGLKDLDRKLGGGFKPGELIVIAGRPGMGKTTAAVSIARQMAKAGHCGGFFSLEMPTHQISARFLSDECYSGTAVINANQILMGHLRPDQAERVHLAGRDFQSLPLALDDSSGLTVGEIGARSRALHTRYQREGKALQFIVVDYLKFVRSSERYRGQRYLEVGEITAGLKALAKDLGIAVILLCQLNRETEKAQDRRPELAHLRDSGEIEQDADVVMFLYREAYYLTKDEDLLRKEQVESKLEIIIAKQRMGPCGPVDVFCNVGASALRDAAGY